MKIKEVLKTIKKKHRYQYTSEVKTGRYIKKTAKELRFIK